MLPARPTLLDAHPGRAVHVGPGAQLLLGLGNVLEVAEHVHQPLAAPDSEVRRVGVGGVVVEADQM